MRKENKALISGISPQHQQVKSGDNSELIESIRTEKEERLIIME